MQSKLTLRVDDRVISNAKKWSKEHNTSLSKLIERYLTKLTNNKESAEIDSWTQSISGVLSTHPASDKQVKKLISKHRDRKYK